MLAIMVVEDDPDQRHALEDALGDRYGVTAVADGAEAIAAGPEHFDLLLTDLRMPGMSGVELKVRLDREGIAVPMILMSSDVDSGRQAVTAGFFAFLAKPLSIDQLDDVIGRVAADKERRISVVDLKLGVAREPGPANDVDKPRDR